MSGIKGVKAVKAKELFTVVIELLAMQKSAWITVTGMSMYPFLREYRDSVELSCAEYSSVRRGDIVLIQRRNGVYVLHRVLQKREDTFFIVGDAQQEIEGPLYPNQLLAVVTRLRREKRVISVSHPVMRLLVWIWLMLRPIRYPIFRMGHHVKRLFRSSL